MSGPKVVQLEEMVAKGETARVVLRSVSISLRYLLVIVNHTAAVLNNPVPTPEQVLDYMGSVPYLSLFITPEK